MTLDEKEQRSEINRQLNKLRMQWFAGDRLIGEELQRVDRVGDMDLPEWGEYVDQLADFDTELRQIKYTLIQPAVVRLVQESRK